MIMLKFHAEETPPTCAISDVRKRSYDKLNKGDEMGHPHPKLCQQSECLYSKLTIRSSVDAQEDPGFTIACWPVEFCVDSTD